MTSPRTMTRHTLNALKGWPRANAVDFEAAIDPDETQPVYSGTCVSQDPTTGLLVRGVSSDSPMPMFLFPDSDDNDIVNDGGDPASDVGAWVAVLPAGIAVALVAIGAYELV